MRKILAVAVLGGLMSAVPAAAATNLVTNGDFATNSLSGWNNVGWFNSVEIGFNPNGEISGAYAGTGCVNQYCTLSQDLATVAGSSYTLNFDFNPGSNVEFGGGETIVYFGGNEVARYTGGVQGWVAKSLTVQATGSVSTLAFSAYQNPAWNGVDNVVVSLATGAVPEPATWAMFIAGFGAVGFAARRRRAVAA